MKDIKNTIESEMNSEGDMVVLQNHLSWSSFNRVRKSQGLSGTKRKRPTENDTEEPHTKRKHGYDSANLPINKEDLLQEVQSWQPDEQVNWSHLGERYGLSMPNRGQVIKEFLAEQGIPAAHINQCKHRAPRRSKKRLPGGQVSFPMYSPVKKVKERVIKKIDSGEIKIGREVVQTTYSRYIAQQGQLTQEKVEVYARKIPLLEIREKLLQKHEQLSIIRNDPDTYFATLPEEAVKARLVELHETYDSSLGVEDLREKLKILSRHRLLKVWHDHSDIAGHPHLLVLVAAVYDPGFYFTPHEMQQKGADIDVPTVVEEPQVHIFGRSSSSLEDQTEFIDCRRECLSDMDTVLYTQAGIPIQSFRQ